MIGTQTVFDAPTGVDRDYFAHAAAQAERQAATARVKANGGKINPRKLPLDASFTYRTNDVSMFMAVDAGFCAGTRSDSQTLRADKTHTWSWKFHMTFIDNSYHDYDHGQHLEVVQRLTPKYATVRDIMSRDQCEAANIPYYDFDQIMAWAEELATGAQHVIIIPKIDCLHEIPERFMLGYSVPTAYGGTPLPPSRFAHRPVHLLGGSWKNQLAYLNVLGDAVVSMDFNHVSYLGRYGTFCYPDGREDTNLRDGLKLAVTNARVVAMAISFGHIGRALFESTHDDRFAMHAGESLAPIAGVLVAPDPEEVDHDVTAPQLLAVAGDLFTPNPETPPDTCGYCGRVEHDPACPTIASPVTAHATIDDTPDDRPEIDPEPSSVDASASAAIDDATAHAAAIDKVTHWVWECDRCDDGYEVVRIGGTFCPTCATSGVDHAVHWQMVPGPAPEGGNDPANFPNERALAPPSPAPTATNGRVDAYTDLKATAKGKRKRPQDDTVPHNLTLF